jgi:hypothetical protein
MRNLGSALRGPVRLTDDRVSDRDGLGSVWLMLSVDETWMAALASLAPLP